MLAIFLSVVVDCVFICTLPMNSLYQQYILLTPHSAVVVVVIAAVSHKPASQPANRVADSSQVLNHRHGDRRGEPPGTTAGEESHDVMGMLDV